MVISCVRAPQTTAQQGPHRQKRRREQGAASPASSRPAPGGRDPKDVDDIGFLGDMRRVNVALTRAQEALGLSGTPPLSGTATRCGQPMRRAHAKKQRLLRGVATGLSAGCLTLIIVRTPYIATFIHTYAKDSLYSLLYE